MLSANKISLKGLTVDPLSGDWQGHEANIRPNINECTALPAAKELKNHFDEMPAVTATLGIGHEDPMVPRISKHGTIQPIDANPSNFQCLCSRRQKC